MDNNINFERPLLALKEENTMSCPQKCRISQRDYKFPASSLVIVKSGETSILCRVFYLNKCYDDEFMCYIDESVRINGEFKEIKYIQEMELINQSQIVEFNEVIVKIYVNYAKLDLKVIKSQADFVDVTKSILKNYSFTSNCKIACNRFGINQIFVTSTSNRNMYGTLNAACVLKIEEILVERTLKWRNFQIGGLNAEKNKLEQIVHNMKEYGMNPRRFRKKPPCQVLVIGPCGSGKSLLIHKVSAKYNCNLFEITGDIFKPYPGETEDEFQKIFKKIIDTANLISSNLSIILIENIELFCPKIDPKIKENSHSSRIASMINSYLDFITTNTRRILVIGTTTKIELVDTSLRRHKRFANEIALEMPNESQRCEIIKILINRNFQNELIGAELEDLSEFVAKNTSGFVGADLELLCHHVLRLQNEIQEEEGDEEIDIKNLFKIGLQKISPNVMRDNLGTVMKSSMSFNDIGGMESIKKSLLTSVLGPLKHPEKFNRFGLKSVSGILLYGASGCAKTTIVKCLAGESNMTLLSVSSAEIYSPYVGEAEKFIVKLFNQARLSAPAILFFDEIDTIVGNRTHSNGTNDAHMRILSTFLTEIDGFGGNSKINENKPVLIVGATNRPMSIDNALLRPGRFDKLIHIPAPDYDNRSQILQLLLNQRPIAQDVNVDDLARRTENFSGADLVNLCNEAGLCAATNDINCEEIKLEDFNNVLSFLRPSLTKEKIEFYEQFERHHSEKATKMEN